MKKLMFFLATYAAAFGAYQIAGWLGLLITIGVVVVASAMAAPANNEQRVRDGFHLSLMALTGCLAAFFWAAGNVYGYAGAVSLTVAMLGYAWVAAGAPMLTPAEKAGWRAGMAVVVAYATMFASSQQWGWHIFYAGLVLCMIAAFVRSVSAEEKARLVLGTLMATAAGIMAARCWQLPDQPLGCLATVAISGIAAGVIWVLLRTPAED